METSYAISAAAIGGAIYLKKAQEPKRAYIPILYFASMEALQGTQYFFVDQCNHPANAFLVYVAWAHVAFQPLFFNIWLSYFIPDKQVAEHFLRFVGKLCFIAGLFQLGRLYVGVWPLCQAGIEYFCGPSPCAYSGNFHVAWQIPLRYGGFFYITPSIFIHFFLYFIPGLIVGRYWIIFLMGLTGPVLSLIITSDINEQPVIWCFFATVQLMLTYKLFRKKQKLKSVPYRGSVSRPLSTHS